MEGSQGRIEGWLFLIRHNRIGLQYSRKRYFVLQDNVLKSFKSIPSLGTEEPVRSAMIASWIRVIDNGREHHHRSLFFIFTLYNTSNHDDTLKLGATSSEEAARWIISLREAAAKPTGNLTSSSKREYLPFSLSVPKRMTKMCAGQTSCAWHVDAMTSDVLAPSPWKIFGCKNGLRFFKEAKDTDSNGKHWDDHPAIMAVGIVDGPSEVVFHTLMSLGNSRTEWDFCFYKGCVVEALDGHTDIIHIQLYNHWLPWAMRRRDLLLRRYWRREDDGTYVILYHSVIHKCCPPKKGYVRSSIKSGGYVITPTKQDNVCVVKHMLAVDWGFWRLSLRKAYERSITAHMLETVAALSEFFKVKSRSTRFEFASGEQPKDIGVPGPDCDNQPEKWNTPEDKGSLQLSGTSGLSLLNDSEDEFFDVPEPSDDDSLENGWLSNVDPESCYMDKHQTKLSSAASFMKKLHDLAVQKKGYVDLQGISWEDTVLYCYGATLPKDTNLNMSCSWATSDPTAFLVRGHNYLEDRKKIKSTGTLLQFVAADWLNSNKREDDMSGRHGGIVQMYAAKGGPEFFFVINIQVPGTTTYSLVLYYMLETPLEETPLLEQFVNGDDAFRNSRFKLIPYISTGSWIVKQSVGRKACLIGQALEINYFRGKNYIELGVDIGSSTVARGVVNLVLGYLSNLVIEMAFLIQGNTPEELPEFLLGTCRLNHLDARKSISADSITGNIQY